MSNEKENWNMIFVEYLLLFLKYYGVEKLDTGNPSHKADFERMNDLWDLMSEDERVSVWDYMGLHPDMFQASSGYVN